MAEKTEIGSSQTEVPNETAQENGKVANEQVAIPKTEEEFKKALQSASSKKMDEFLKKYDATKLSDIEEKLVKVSELEKQLTAKTEAETKSQSLEDKIKELQKIIDEQTPIINEKRQTDFLKENNINPEFKEDFFTLYEKKLNEDKSNEAEVIKGILEKHPNMSSVKLNEIKTSVSKTEKKDEGKEADDKLRKAFGLPPKK